MSAWFMCPHCEEYFEEGTEEFKTISGRTGGYENWLPDETRYYCPECEHDITDDACDEVDVPDVLERVEYYKDLAEKLLGVARTYLKEVNYIDNPWLSEGYREELNELERKL